MTSIPSILALLFLAPHRATGATVALACKKELFAAIGALKRAPSAATRRSVLEAVEDVEALRLLDGSVEGEWSLIFSTQIAGSVRKAPDPGPLQPILDSIYSAFFKVAPALAGSLDGSSSGASNVQSVDLVSGTLLNRVRIPLAGGVRLEIDVDGTVAPDPSAGVTDLSVVFESCTFRLRGAKRGDAGDAGLRLPLPRPVGSLRTTHCDADLRISRGGRGGVFVLRRLTPAAAASPVAEAPQVAGQTRSRDSPSDRSLGGL